MNILPGRQFNIDEFKNPANEYSVTYMWFWNVPVSKELIDRELREYLKAGITSLYIVPLPKDFSPEGLRTYLDPEYLSDEFFDLVEYTLRECVRLGIKPWIYDEGGWPSGGACYNTVRHNPKAKLKIIEKREVSLRADKRFYPEENFVALFNGKHRLPDEYIASRDVTLTAYYVSEKILNGCRVDYTNGSVTDTFISNTHERYKARVGDLFGSEIPIFFTDEPGLMDNSVADNEFELFIKEFGYDLRDYAYVLTDGGENAVTEDERRARIDHYVLLGKLFKENTFKKLHDWCEKNGTYYSGHLDIDNRPRGGMIKGVFSMVDALRQFHVPGVDVIWEQIRYPHGGRAPLDDETLGMGFFPRLASSAARQTGHNVSVTESLGIYGDGLTHDTIRYVVNYQFIRGINAMNFAPISLGSSRLAALMTRPNFRPEKPGFYNLKEINDYIRRMSYLTRLGYAEGDTALYMPCRDYCAGYDVCDDATVTFKALGTALEESNIAFDIIDDEGILSARVTDGGLKLGDGVYRHIAVPENRYMPAEVKEKIAPYLGIGEPTYKFKNDKLRAMTRRLDNGRLWFIFNEGEPTVREALDIGDGKRIYRIDARSGEIYAETSPVCEIACGDIWIYLVCEDEIEAVSADAVLLCEAGDFVPFSHRRFILDYKGVYNEWGDGNVDITPEFSGEVSYRGTYSLPEEPKAEDRYRIRLEGFSASVSVRPGDRDIPLGMSPMYAIVKGDELKKSGTIEVTVANTALNEIAAKRYVIDSMPEAERGLHYKRKLSEFESRIPPLKFGRVYVEKMI